MAFQVSGVRGKRSRSRQALEKQAAGEPSLEDDIANRGYRAARLRS